MLRALQKFNQKMILIEFRDSSPQSTGNFNSYDVVMMAHKLKQILLQGDLKTLCIICIRNVYGHFVVKASIKMLLFGLCVGKAVL